jgi:tetratricopeptide (TPR) repeat protein
VVIYVGEALAAATSSSATHRAYADAVATCVPTLLGSDLPLAERLLARLDAIEPEVRETDPAACAWIYHARSWKALYEGDVGACRTIDSSIVECFKAAGDLRHACQQIGNVGYDELLLGAHERAEASLREAMATSRHLGLHQVTAQSEHNLSLALMHMGRLEESRALQLGARDAFHEHGNRRLEGAAYNYLALISLAENDFEAAERALERALALWSDLDVLRIYALAVLSETRRRQGRTQEALGPARELMALLDSSVRAEEGEAYARLAHAEALESAGHHDEARRAIGQAERILVERASRIRDPLWRKSFLESVPENARTIALARAWNR